MVAQFLLGPSAHVDVGGEQLLTYSDEQAMVKEGDRWGELLSWIKAKPGVLLLLFENAEDVPSAHVSRGPFM
jgi:hypothetical protein